MRRNSEEAPFTMGAELRCDGSGQSVPGFPKTSKPETLGCLSAWDVKVEFLSLTPLRSFPKERQLGCCLLHQSS